jgi:hypothetical protein
VVSNRALVSSERPLGASPFFDKVLSGKAETADETRLERPLARVLKELARTSPPWRADDLALAIGISIRSVDDIPNDLLAIREELQKLDPPVFELTSTEAYSGPGSDIAAIVRGTFSPPSFRDGNYLRRDEKGRPVAEGTETIGFTLAVPKGAQLEKAPIIMYQHGQPGKSETQVANYANRGLARAGFAVIGFTDVVNREIIPDGDVVKLNTDALLAFLNTHDMPDYLELLTNAEQLAFLRVLPQLDQLDVLPLDSPDGVPDLDPSKPLGYLGVSQGSVHGIGFLSFAPEIRAAALVTGAGRLAATLIHQAFEPLYGGIAGVAPKLTRTQLYAGLALVQMVYDRQDSQNLARYLRREPLELGSERRASVLMTEGLDDPLIPPCATRSGAWQLGLPQLAPQALRVPSLRLAEAPLVANIDEHTTSAFFQYVPAGSQQATPSPGCVEIGEKDGHDCAQVAAEAIRQRVEFFVTGLTGAPRIIDPTPPE